MNSESKLGHVHVYQPGNSDRTVIACHGTGGDELSLVRFAEVLLPGAPVLGVRGNVLEGSMPRFFGRIAEGIFDQEEVARRARDFAAFIEGAAAHYHFDRDKAVGFGYSNGANILHSALMLDPSTLGQAVLLRAMPTLDPLPNAELSGKRILLAQGKNDDTVPTQMTQLFADHLRQCGASVELYWHAGGHELSRAEIEFAAKWLNS